MESDEPQFWEDVGEFKPDRIQVWSAVPKGTTTEVWFVSLWEGEGETIVYDGPTESGAMEAAQDCADDWNIPIIAEPSHTLN